MNGKLLIILAIVIASCTHCLAHNTHINRNQYRRLAVHRDIQRDDPRTSRNGEHLVAVEDEEKYVPASFNFDYDPSNGNGAYHSHAIEMMEPVEVPEYDWREDGSRGISELDRDGPEAAMDNSQELLSPGSAGQIQRCGDREIDPRHAVCCDGLVYRKTADQQDGGKCCGRVAYDDRYFTCCQGRAIVRRNGRLPLCCGDYNGRDALPDQCREGYQNDTTGLGSTCCRSSNPAGAWKCCIKGQGCCAEERSTAVDVPGFRPACCHLANEDLTSQCCAATYEKIRVLPDCCSGERLRPVCCKKRHSTDVKCCPGTIGYCCGIDETAVRTTAYPPRLILETRHPIHPQPVTYPPRPTHTDRLVHYPFVTYPPRSIYSTRIPYIYPTEQAPLPRPTQPLYPRYTARGAPTYSTVRYSPGLVVGASPSCCRGRTQQRACCLRTRSPTCCSSLPRCCLYFNVTCCGSQMQQQQHQQQQQQGVRNLQGYGGVGVDREAEVRLLSESELRQNNGHRQSQAQLPSNGHISNHNPRHQQQQQYHGGGGGSVTLSCCRLETTRDAAACCRNGYQESGRLPLCCISSPGELSPGDPVEGTGGVQNDAPGTSHRYQHRNGTVQRSRQHGQAISVCNGMAFDVEVYLCCSNVLRRRQGFRPACCNGAVYDSYLYKCCDDGRIRSSCGSGSVSRPRNRHV